MINILGTDGTLIPVRGRVVGHLAVTRRPARGPESWHPLIHGWSITHVPTGARLPGLTYHKAADALAAVRRMAPWPEWAILTLENSKTLGLTLKDKIRDAR